jgi:hypothetical protein
MNKCFIFLVAFLFFSCNKLQQTQPPNPAEVIKQEVRETDFAKFLVSSFPDLKNEITKKLQESKSQDISNNRTITLLTFDTPQTETFVIWEKKGDYYRKLFSMHDRGGAIQSVSEYDLNMDGMLDLLLKSCSEAYGTYVDIFINKSNSKHVKYERVIKTVSINPVILDLNNDNLPEIILVNDSELPFNLSADHFASDEHRFIHNEKKLLEIQKLHSDFETRCDPMINTPMLVNYPIKIYNISKYGSLIEVTVKHPEILSLHLESIFYSNFLNGYAKNPKMKGLWKNYLLTYLDSYYILKTDSSYWDYLKAKQEKFDAQFPDSAEN